MSREAAARGFTLLELLIVLSLLGLLSALVAPRMLGWVESSQHRQRLQALRQELEALPQQAFLNGMPLHWQGQPELAPTLPSLAHSPGWRLRAKPGLHIDANGMTEAARLELLDASGQVIQTWWWSAPAGRLGVLPADETTRQAHE